MLLISDQKLIRSVSIKDQCSRRNFYGGEQVFEDFLQHFEEQYGRIMSSFAKGEVSTHELNTLMRFLLLQSLRTPFMLQNRKDMIDALRDTEIGGMRISEHPNHRFDFENALEMQHSIYIAATSNDIFDDLEVVLLFNHTNCQFITSDNPAIRINRLYQQRYRDETAGMIQSGAIVGLPLSSGIYLLGFDPDVYKPIGKHNVLIIDNDNDIDRINSLQVQTAVNSIYFQYFENSEYVMSIAQRYIGLRRDTWVHNWIGVLDGEANGFEKFRKIEPDDEGTTATRIATVSQILPVPASWPTFIEFKARPRGFTNGSSVGYVRRSVAEKSPGRGLVEQVLPRRIPFGHTAQGREVIWQRKS